MSATPAAKGTPPKPAKRALPPIDVARLLPPPMRKAVSGARFAYVRMGLWVLFVAVFCWAQLRGGSVSRSPSSGEAPSDEASSERLSYDGKDGRFVVRATADGDVLSIDGAPRPLLTAGATTAIDDGHGRAWSATIDDKGQLVVSHPDRLGFVVRAHGPNEWVVRGAAGATLYKVKVKDDKFNVYDADDKRIARGKQKRGAIVVRDDGETQLATIDGAAALDDAAWLAVPLPIEVRVLAARKHGAISTAE